MQRLRPEVVGVSVSSHESLQGDGLVQLLDEERPSPPPNRPWVTSNMVMSLDGAYAVEGRSGGLGSDGDRRLFLAQRSLADAILVGASTVRRERYRRPTVGGAAAAVRARRGQSPEPLVVVTSRSMDLPADLPLLDGASPTPVIAHPAAPDAELPAGAEGLVAGDDGDVDVRLLLTLLNERGLSWVVCEGGPGLLGQLAAHDLVDEYLLTLSPRLVGGEDTGLLAGGRAEAGEFALHRVLRDGDHLLLSYRRSGTG